MPVEDQRDASARRSQIGILTPEASISLAQLTPLEYIILKVVSDHEDSDVEVSVSGLSTGMAIRAAIYSSLSIPRSEYYSRMMYLVESPMRLSGKPLSNQALLSLCRERGDRYATLHLAVMSLKLVLSTTHRSIQNLASQSGLQTGSEYPSRPHDVEKDRNTNQENDFNWPPTLPLSPPPSRPSSRQSIPRISLPAEDASTTDITIFLKRLKDRRRRLQLLKDLAVPSNVDHAVQFCDTLQYWLDLLPSERPLTLRLLQDVSAVSNQLPTKYWLKDLHVIRKRRVERGGEADIYEGMLGPPDSGVKVAVREVLPPESTDWESTAGVLKLKTIRREVLTHWQLRHPNLLVLLGVFQDDEHEAPVIVLPFIARGSALAWLKSNKGSHPFVRIIAGATRGLSYLHTQDPPVIHGDLHPGNILVGDDGQALLCDFGLSRSRYEVTRTLTQIETGGKLRFLAPELSSGPDQFRTTEASDIYALSMCFYYLGTLKPPFYQFGNDLKVMIAAQKGERPLKPSGLGMLGGEEKRMLWGWMVDMWDHDPSKRPRASVITACVDETVFLGGMVKWTRQLSYIDASSYR